MRWFRNKSFVVKMVDSNDVDQAEETVVIDIDKTVDKTVQAVLMVMGAYMVLSTARQLLIGHPDPSQITNTIAPIFNNDNSSVVNFGGTVSKIVKCVETGQTWEKVTEAAAGAKDGIGVPLSVMSKHLNEYPGYEDVGNLHYKIIGISTQG